MNSLRYLVSMLSLLVFWMGNARSIAALTDPPEIRVASKPFTESYILSEMVAQIIDDTGEAKAMRKFGLGGPTLVVDGPVSYTHLIPCCNRKSPRSRSPPLRSQPPSSARRQRSVATCSRDRAAGTSALPSIRAPKKAARCVLPATEKTTFTPSSTTSPAAPSILPEQRWRWRLSMRSWC